MQLTIFQLPADLLHIISSMLPVRSQGCLALTCKTYHTEFKSVFHDDFFKIPGIEAESSKSSDGLELSQNLGQRSIDCSLFLIQTQLEYLRHDASCRKLHPRCEFDEHELGKQDEV